jgi:hypothetical protein
MDSDLNTEAFFHRQMKWMYTSFQAVYEAALDFEVIQQDNGTPKPIAMAVVKEAIPGRIRLPPPLRLTLNGMT